MAYIGNQPTSVAFVTDQFSGNGSTVAFTTSVAPANTASVLVSVSGVLQDPTTYSVSGLTLTFSTAPPSGTANISCRYLGIPASGVTTTAYRTVTEFTATASQTTFTPASYTVGFIDVYRNGTRLGTADFTATNGTTVVLATGASSGDLVTTESFLVSSVLNAIPATAGSVTPVYLSGNAPQVTTYTSGSGTYTTPSNAKAIWVRMVGGGGGGGASDTNNGTAGGNTTFGTAFLAANGGGAGGNGAAIGGSAGSGGTASGGDVNSTGSTGGAGAKDTGNPTGGMGGNSVFGGASTGGRLSSAGSNASGYGSGGGGGGGASGALNSAGGGGAGGYVEKLITSPSATYSYAVGAGGNGGAAGSYVGGNGSSGLITITAYF